VLALGSVFASSLATMTTEEFEACPYCGSTEFRGGPRGYCRHVECAWCGARFSLFLFRDYPVMLINILAGPRGPEAPGKPH
jgi:hypothetical protein